MGFRDPKIKYRDKHDYPKSSTTLIIYKQKFNEISHYTHSTKIYTDSFKINFNVDIAIICSEKKLTYKIMFQCSIYFTEAFAIFKTTVILSKNNIMTTILSDS